ncbi:hypothetical protein [Aminobacter carboxidus]|uniref:Uncharacterized protein n=1 Tax=Aminobacter carboxidus TaxID=376165 RepID=A0A8E1WCI6_9HYPH|nr:MULTISPECIES: hypothetical protein [Aminobacter carboxidus group]MBB6465056.1 hypothetical protein [Aminobacter lissarensis]MBE1207062.1 hypothetical protein [Aminobacter carboxidus]
MGSFKYASRPWRDGPGHAAIAVPRVAETLHRRARRLGAQHLPMETQATPRLGR